MILLFADCELDTARRTLICAGQNVHLEPQVFDLIAALASAGGKVLDRDAIVDLVWNGRIVSDSAISARIHAARQAVGDDGRAQSVIRTVTGVGFQMAVPVNYGEGGTDVDAEPFEQSVHVTHSRDGTRLAWASSGEGTGHHPAVMRGGHWLTHLEMDRRHPVWAPLLSRLNQDRRLVRYDVRGTGVSGKGPCELGLDCFVDDMLAVLDASGEHQVDIVAASQNVPVTIAFAARYPERVRRLVFLSGFLRGADIRSDAVSSMTDAFIALMQNGWGDGASPFMQSFYTFYLPDSTEDERKSFAQIMFASASSDMAIQYRRSIGRFDVTELASKIQVPVMIVHAQNDAVNPLSEAQDMAMTIPDSQLVVLDSANHIPLPRDPEWSRGLAQAMKFLS